jgi:hypothetical protein
MSASLQSTACWLSVTTLSCLWHRGRRLVLVWDLSLGRVSAAPRRGVILCAAAVQQCVYRRYSVRKWHRVRHRTNLQEVHVCPPPLQVLVVC